MASSKIVSQRHQFISEVITTKKIHDRETLLKLLKKNTFSISNRTLEKDLKDLKIRYSKKEKRFIFVDDSLKMDFIKSKLINSLREAGVIKGSKYKVYKPIVYGSTFQIDEINENNTVTQLAPLFYGILITCKLGHEQLLYTTISKNTPPNCKFITGQINIGSIFLIFDNAQKALNLFTYLDVSLFEKTSDKNAPKKRED